MKEIRYSCRILMAVLAGLLLTACSKTLRWEEEVLLNTGEIIWVSKEVRYTLKGQPGNPADVSLLPDFTETTSFDYGGRNYTYTGDAGLLVLAISPEKLPVLIAPAGSRGWYRRHSYKCVHPYYVMFVPDSTGQQWSWPDKIEPWTYNLPTNLMVHRDHPSKAATRYTMADKSRQGLVRDSRTIHIRKIDPLFVSDICKGSN